MSPVRPTQATHRVHSLAATAALYARRYTKVCNACTAFGFVCRLAHRTNQRLARLRQRETRQRHEAILAHVREEIQKIHAARQTSTEAEEAAKPAAHTSTQQPAATPRVYTYICPHCATSMQSTVATGQVDHRRGDGCGKEFRVANGLLAGRTYSHTCPTCGAMVRSTKASGRIQVTHRNPKGKLCRTNHWHVHN